MQAHVLGNGFTQGVTVEKHMPDQSHPLGIHHFSGVQPDSRIARYQLGVFPQPVMGIGGHAPVRVGELRHGQPGQLFHPWRIENTLAFQIVNQRQRAGGSDQGCAGGV